LVGGVERLFDRAGATVEIDPADMDGGAGLSVVPIGEGLAELGADAFPVGGDDQELALGGGEAKRKNGEKNAKKEGCRECLHAGQVMDLLRRWQ